MSPANQTRESAMLILPRGTEAGLTWTLERQTLTIGRSPDCDVVLDDRQVSRFHARILWCDDHYEIEDLDSKNGTHLNGRDVLGSQRLRDGDEIQIALRFKLAFVDAGATAPLAFDGGARAGLRLDTATHQVWVNNKLLEPSLSAQQYRLLELIHQASGIVVRDDIVRAVWPDADEVGVSEQSIDALVRRLRERLAELDPEHQYIVTMRGHGFRFENRT
ncbi:MAG: FHA domain-containing protein [Chloroflexi bacterium]|nr:FHA domain-containing protein [Chloroflexota bacterium]